VRSARRIAIPRREIASLQETAAARTWPRLIERERSARDHSRFVLENDVKTNRQEIDMTLVVSALRDAPTTRVLADDHRRELLVSSIRNLNRDPRRRR